MKNYFILHGTFGNNKENWFPWLEQKIIGREGICYNLNYPTPQGMSFESWSKVLDKYRNEITEDSCFICHSSSCMFIVKYCIVNNVKIGKCIFVSGFNNYYFLKEFDKLNKDFYFDDISIFKDLCKSRICIYSKDDPYVKFDYLEDFANKIDAERVIFEKAGHFNKASGFDNFEDILKFL